jgi:hypothetical protein
MFCNFSLFGGLASKSTYKANSRPGAARDVGTVAATAQLLTGYLASPDHGPINCAHSLTANTSATLYDTNSK